MLCKEVEVFGKRHEKKPLLPIFYCPSSIWRKGEVVTTHLSSESIMNSLLLCFLKVIKSFFMQCTYKPYDVMRTGQEKNLALIFFIIRPTFSYKSPTKRGCCRWKKQHLSHFFLEQPSYTQQDTKQVNYINSIFRKGTKFA